METTTPGTQLLAKYRHELVSVNNILLHVVMAGPEDGELVVLLHGFPEFWYGWRHQIDVLADAGYRVLIPDQRGYNLSEKPKNLEDYRIDHLADDINMLVRWAKRDQAVIIGHDWGAMVAWWLAILHPRRVKKLGILNVPHPKVFEKTLRSNIRQMLRSTYAGFFQIPWLPETLTSLNDYRPFASAMQNSALPGSFTDADMDTYRAMWSRPGAMRAMLNWYRAYAQLSKPEVESFRIRVPTLMLWGMNDFALGSEMAQPSIEMCDDGRLIELPEATHWVQHDAANKVNRHLLEFLES
jgi:pimeloyl-ACP methyl ester carboxylesterase